ncbi:urea transporter 1-like [Athalia rosae]|uniref:urea transporter 1-like n=1 Tax=Athalia rosae TaxID=37344 RepID=UPI0020346AF4|nr:urea transporter 1-like [Athalia rosae]
MSSVRRQEKQWVSCIGDFTLSRDFLSRKRTDSPWITLKILDALLRGYGQVVCANNPISGLLILAAFTVVTPGMAFIATCTGVLGLLLSMMIGESQVHIENGLTVFNPLLIGVLTHHVVPDIYDSLDGRLLVYLLMAVVLTVYLTRALGSGRLPCLSASFNFVQLILIFTLASRGNNAASVTNNTTIEINVTETSHHSASGDSHFNDPTILNVTNVDVDWGMVFRGMVTSSSQVFAVDNVAVSSIIYLAILTYSPIMAAFAFAGAMLGSLTGLVFNVPLDEIYCGLWGYNGLLTSAILGGLLIILGCQTTMATILASIFATILQTVLTPLFAKAGLPVLSVPFVVTTWLFLGLRGPAGSTFVEPEDYSFPEKMRYEYIESQQTTAISSRSEDSNELEIFKAERQALK